MSEFEADVRRWILKTLLAARGPLLAAALMDAIRTRFPAVTFTVGDLKQYIGGCETDGFIAGTDDGFGVMWDLTTKGKIKAQQL